MNTLKKITILPLLFGFAINANSAAEEVKKATVEAAKNVSQAVQGLLPNRTDTRFQGFTINIPTAGYELAKLADSKRTFSAGVLIDSPVWNALHNRLGISAHLGYLANFVSTPKLRPYGFRFGLNFRYLISKRFEVQIRVGGMQGQYLQSLFEVVFTGKISNSVLISVSQVLTVRNILRFMTEKIDTNETSDNKAVRQAKERMTPLQVSIMFLPIQLFGF